MAKLMVITCPPVPGGKKYTVVLGDCVLPGFVLGRYDNEREADSACRSFGKHYNVKAYPIETPWKRRDAFLVIQGGRTE